MPGGPVGDEQDLIADGDVGLSASPVGDAEVVVGRDVGFAGIGHGGPSDIKVHEDNNYENHPEITQLPKDPKGQYYLDEANGVRYPVDPNWDFGHNSGFENRTIIADAQACGLTQEQMAAEVNDHPERFHVEDSTGSRSHRRGPK